MCWVPHFFLQMQTWVKHYYSSLSAALPGKDINTVCQACLQVYWILPMAMSGMI